MRILIIRLSALGDVLTASPVSRVIHQAGGQVVWAVERRCAEAVIGNPYVDEVIVLPSSSDWRQWLGRGRLGEAARAAGELRRQLRGRPFDAVVDLQGLYKSAAVAAVARSARKIMPHDAGERCPLAFTETATRRVAPDHIATMYVSLLEPLGLHPAGREDLRLIMPVGDDDRAWARDWLAARGLRAGGYLAIAPGTTRPQKMWPEEYWPALLARVSRQFGLPAVVVGGPAEAELAARLRAAATSPLASAVGGARLRQTGALLEAARVTVAVDTGPMHMAVAVGCPTISLFGSTGPRLFDDGSRYVCLHRQFACWPCDRHPICRRYDCLRAIRVQDVAAAVGNMIAR